MSIQLPDFSKARVLVVGDLMLDRYWTGETTRVSPEAPVPVVRVNNIDERAGGAANVAMNVRSLGGEAGLLGLYGDDEAGQALLKILETVDIAVHGVQVDDVPTITKLRVLSHAQQLIRVDFEDKQVSKQIEKLTEVFSQVVSDYDVVVLSDYAKGALHLVTELIRITREKGVNVLVDPKGNDFSKYQGATLITPNAKEFHEIVGETSDEDDFIRQAQQLRESLQIEHLLVTRSEKGMLLVSQDAINTVHANAKEVADVTGAGDTAIATLATGIAAGLSTHDAMEISNYAAGVIVGKLGTSVITPAELRSSLHRQGVGGRTQRDVQGLRELVEEKQALGKKVVMTNGCFDILHAGHIRFLEEAKSQGDYLVVAVNDDASVKRLKGEERPVNNLEDRMAVLSALAAVNWVVPFAEDTPRDLIATLLPDVLVKGGDYKVEEIAGGKEVIAAGGDVRVLMYHEGRSTTRIINSIRKS